MDGIYFTGAASSERESPAAGDAARAIFRKRRPRFGRASTALGPRPTPEAMVSPLPAIRRVLETSLYVDDMARAVAFYRDVLGLRVMGGNERLTPIDAGGGTLLLLFRRGATREGIEYPGGRIPPHDGAGPLHVAFAVDEAAFERWLARFAEHGIPVEAVNHWERGGRSAYVRDPDGHSLEIATPGVWDTY